MKNFMNSVKLASPTRSHQDLLWSNTLSWRFGEVVPHYYEDCVPSDSITINSFVATKMAPMIAPIFQPLEQKQEFFTCPWRLVWPNWPWFISTPQTDPDRPVFPTITIKQPVQEGSLADYLGIEVADYTVNHLKISAIPLAIHVMIFNIYYRDENLMPFMDAVLVDGDNTTNTVYTDASGAHSWLEILLARPFRRCYTKDDLFMSALPFKQKGDPVSMPLGTTAPLNFINPNTASQFNPITGGLNTPGSASFTGTAGNPLQNTSNIAVAVNNTANLEVNLAAATAATFETWRETKFLQTFLERLGLAGGGGGLNNENTRYNEFIKAIFGVDTKDARLQRPELLGRVSDFIAISEVLQTSQTTNGDEPSQLGGYSGHGVGAVKAAGIKVFETEFSSIHGYLSCLPKPKYMQGIEKRWFKFDPLEYLNPMAAHLGETAIRNVELFANTTQSNRDLVFGYSRMFYEYCQRQDRVHGEFLSTLDYWHLGLRFLSVPVLNQEFIQVDEDETRRIFIDIDVLNGTDTFYSQTFFKVDALRPLPKYGTPGI